MPTYPKTKKYLMHLKMSKGDNYLHEHELYEMMRSRELYNVHKDLRKKLCRTIRGIEDAERVHIATIEAQRLLFVQRAARKVRERLKLTKVNPEDLLQLTGTNSENPEGDSLMRILPVNKHASGSYTFVQLPRFLDADLCDTGKEGIPVREANTSKNRCLHGIRRLPHGHVESRSGDARLLPTLKLQREQMCMETRRRNRDTLDDNYSPTLKSRFRNIRTARLENIRQYTQLLQGQVHEFNLG